MCISINIRRTNVAFFLCLPFMHIKGSAACAYSSCEPGLSKLYLLVSLLKKLINNSRGKYKRNECLINVCKSDTDLS
jgi:hypothetical protein